MHVKFFISSRKNALIMVWLGLGTSLVMAVWIRKIYFFGINIMWIHA